MATDVEESDTDDHERPAPPKRQCTRLVNSNESYESLNQRLDEAEDRASKSEKCEYDEVERLAREKLSIWQACQVAKGSLDNTINRVMENYTLSLPVTYSLDDQQFRLFRDRDTAVVMEDTAVMMAIRNHGLVHTRDNDALLSQSQALRENAILDRCSSDERPELLRRCTTNRLPDEASDSSTFPMPSSSAIFDGTRSTGDDRCASASWTEDEKMDEGDREQDFLERAVAEAIKKKGLSALSVD